MARRPQDATKLDVDLSDDERSEWIESKNTRSIPASSERKFSRSAQMPNQVDSAQHVGRSSENLFQRTPRVSTSSEALFMSPTSRMLYDRSSQSESNQATGLPEYVIVTFRQLYFYKVEPLI